jgi:hypothetical protein
MKRIFSVLAVATAAAFVTLTPLAAQAHDEIVATSPVADSTVSAGVIDLSITFNEDIMKNPDLSGEVFQLVEPNDNGILNLDGGCLDVNGPTLSTKVNLDKAGTYQVNWRSVSNDGHPNEGSFSFTLTNDSGYQASSPTSELSGKCAAVYEVSAMASPEATAEPMLISARVDDEAKPAGTDAASLIVGYSAGAVAVLLGAAVLIAIRKRF